MVVKRKVVLVGLTVFLLGLSFCLAQTPDVFRVEYMLMPRNNSDVKLERFKILANLPVQVSDSKNLVFGAEYNRFVYNLDDDLPFANTAPENFHVIDFNLAYVLKFKLHWRFIGVVTPRFSSTFTEPLAKDDFFLNATVGFFRERKEIEKPTRLILGVAYNATVALRIPLPIIYYEKRFRPDWSFVVGVPKTALKYHIDEKQQIQAEFFFDGYYVNLQNNIVLADMVSASSASSSAALVTLGYQYKLAKNTFLYGYVGHTVFQDAVLRNADRSAIFTVNDDPSFYFRTGFRIGL